MEEKKTIDSQVNHIYLNASTDIVRQIFDIEKDNSYNRSLTKSQLVSKITSIIEKESKKWL